MCGAQWSCADKRKCHFLLCGLRLVWFEGKKSFARNLERVCVICKQKGQTYTYTCSTIVLTSAFAFESIKPKNRHQSKMKIYWIRHIRKWIAIDVRIVRTSFHCELQSNWKWLFFFLMVRVGDHNMSRWVLKRFVLNHKCICSSA